MKGIDPKAREIAKDLARRSGLTLGEWLNQMITDGTEPSLPEVPEPPPKLYESRRYPDPAADFPRPADRMRRNPDPLISDHEAGRIASALDNLSARMEAAEGRSSAAINHIDRAVRSALARIDAGERDASSLGQKVEGALNLIRSEQRRADDRMSRLERDETARIDALRALETAVARVRPEVVAEAAADKMADRLAAAETHSREAMEKLEQSLAGLDRRLAETEDRGARTADVVTASMDHMEHQLERLAEDLSARVEASRRDMAERLRQVVTAERIEVLEDAINQLAGQVDQTERNSAQAIDRMGREVMKIADAISERVTGVEQRNVGIADRLAGEVGKLAEAMEKRLLRADYAHTEALQKLSGEISRVAERLSDRLARNEGRTAEVLEAVGLQQRRQAETAALEVGAIASELTDRIRKSEERTARLLDETQARLEAKLSDAERRTSARAALEASAAELARTTTAAPAAAPPSSGFGRTQTLESLEFDPLADSGFIEPPTLDSVDAFEQVRSRRATGPSFHSQAANPASDDPFEQNSLLGDPFEDDAFAGDLEAATDRAQALFRDAGVERPSIRRRIPEADSMPGAPSAGAIDSFADIAAPAPLRSPAPDLHDEMKSGLDGSGFGDDDFFGAPLKSGHAGMEADAAFDAFAQIDDFGHENDLDIHAPTFSDVPPVELPVDSGRVSTRDLIARARNAAKNAAPVEKPSRGKPSKGEAATEEEPRKGPFGLPLPRRKAKAGSNTALTMVLATGVSLTVTAAVLGFAILNSQSKDAPRAGLSIAGKDTTGASPRTDATAPPSTAGAPTQLTVATAADPGAAPPAGEPSASARSDDPRLIYSAAVREIETNDPNGLPNLTRAANLGFGPAQFHLSTLFDKGSAGVARDPVKARQWAERAAKAGIPKAMYNLGLFMFDGKGGPPDLPQAAEWFRRAASLGLGDAQYNLARLYENGYGVPQNFSQAYMWYLIAANGGDRDARADADRLRPTLTAEARVSAERSANAFRPATTATAGVAAR